MRDSRFHIPSSLSPFSHTLQRIWRTASQKTTCLWALTCRGCKCSCSQAARKETCENPSQGEGQHLRKISVHGSSKLQPSSCSPGASGGWESSCTPSALPYPGGTDPASQAQSFVSLSPGLQKSICVFLKVRRHQKYSVCCNTNTGSASVLQNQIKALEAANYAMEDLKNPRKHCSSCLKCPHAGVMIRNGCFKLQYI